MIFSQSNEFVRLVLMQLSLKFVQWGKTNKWKGNYQRHWPVGGSKFPTVPNAVKYATTIKPQKAFTQTSHITTPTGLRCVSCSVFTLNATNLHHKFLNYKTSYVINICLNSFLFFALFYHSFNRSTKPCVAFLTQVLARMLNTDCGCFENDNNTVFCLLLEQ